MTVPNLDVTSLIGANQACWLALAHEKVGMYEGALRFGDLQLETDLLKAGTPNLKWPQVIALACKGRVFAKLNRHDEALIAFQAAIAAAKESYSMMAAFAYRELANYAGGGDASIQASKNLETKLATFEGRMTRAEFDRMTIGPPLQHSGFHSKVAELSEPPASQISALDEALLAYLARVLQVPKSEPVIIHYAAALRSEGWDTPDDFDDLTIEELKGEPFCFKAGHLKKVAKMRMV